MEREELVAFWIESADRDFKAMESLFSSGHHVWALFVGHLAVEKLLKACHVQKVGVEYPRIHNLLKLAERASLELTEQQQALLDEVTAFNIRARYPDYKNRFYKTATREFTRDYLAKIKEFRQWLLQEMMN